MKRVVTHGKAILAGEHAVVRGAPAIVFPLKSRSLALEWKYKPGAEAVECDGGDLAEPFRAALDRALTFLKAKLPTGTWSFRLTSDIPVRAGLGSSAALSVAIARFLNEQYLARGDVFPLALELENLFHGTSSGIDVAAAMAQGPIQFRRGMSPRALATLWQPNLMLHDTGLRSSTKACVEKVIARNDAATDARMEAAVAACERALLSPEAEGFPQLVRALEEAEACFASWGLIPEPVKTQADALRKAGALAVKPTGSGDGGYLLALWPKGKIPEGALPISGS